MPRSVIKTAQQILELVDDGDSLYDALREFIDEAYIEIPEANAAMWGELQNILNNRVMGRELPPRWDQIRETAMGDAGVPWYGR